MKPKNENETYIHTKKSKKTMKRNQSKTKQNKYTVLEKLVSKAIQSKYSYSLKTCATAKNQPNQMRLAFCSN